MAMSAYDLAHTYFTTYRKPNLVASDENKKRVLTRIEELLDSGWTEYDIINRWLDKDASPSGGNLLRSSEFYWHNQLRLMPGPARMELDIDTGTISHVREPWFLEMRASYTVDDMLDHYLRLFGLARGQVNVNKHLGTFRHLLTRHDVDLLLFMIDACVNGRKDGDEGPPLDPIVVGEYLREAESALNRKITENRNVGSDKIVPKQRAHVAD